MIESILARVGIPVLINVLTETLNTIDSPITRGAAKALEEVDRAIAQGQISNEQIAEANRHAEEMAKMEMEARGEAVSAINETMRAEVASEDKYVRRMRPTFGYLMAFTWAAQMFGIAYVIIFETEKAVFVLNGMANLSAIWAVGLSVLGIYVYKRSEDKKISLPETILWRKQP